MRISKVEVENLRCIETSTVHFSDYTCLVGPNGAGKSTILCALNIFFRENEHASTDLSILSSQDFHRERLDKPITVTVTFSHLSVEAKQDFKDYVREDVLVVSAEAIFDQLTGKAEVRQFGYRRGMANFAKFFQLYGDNGKVADLLTLFNTLKVEHPEIEAARTKDAMYQSLRDYESARSKECVLLKSGDEFYGVSKGSNRLQKYLQWVYIPAVKDASEEQTEGKTGAIAKLLTRALGAKLPVATELDTILNVARESYSAMLNKNQQSLSDLSARLQTRLAEWAHPDAKVRLEWKQDPLKAVRVEPPLASVVAGEGFFEGDITRFGHGFQRSFLLSLLQEIAINDAPHAPRLVLACEEPELYQHPPQAKHLASVFEALSKANAQVLVTTHSPYFIVGGSFESIRMVRRATGSHCSSVSHYTYDDYAADFEKVAGSRPIRRSEVVSKLHQTLQPVLNEMFFTDRLLLVEGTEDIAYLHSWLMLTKLWEDYRRSGCHVVPVSGKNNLLPAAIIAKGLGIPFAIMFDCDGHHKGKDREDTECKNLSLLRFAKQDTSKIFIEAASANGQLFMWPNTIENAVKDELKQKMGTLEYETFDQRVRSTFGFAGDLNKKPLFIAQLLSGVHDQNITVECLDKLCVWALGEAYC